MPLRIMLGAWWQMREYTNLLGIRLCSLSCTFGNDTRPDLSPEKKALCLKILANESNRQLLAQDRTEGRNEGNIVKALPLQTRPSICSGGNLEDNTPSSTA